MTGKMLCLPVFYFHFKNYLGMQVLLIYIRPPYNKNNMVLLKISIFHIFTLQCTRHDKQTLQRHHMYVNML